jgi:hypothetical protein
MARVMTSGMVITLKIGQSAAKSLNKKSEQALYSCDAVHRLNGGGVLHRHMGILRYSRSYAKAYSRKKV